MRIVVFSDSHNRKQPLRKIILAQPRAELFLHLGDGESDYKAVCEAYPHKRIHFVAGNCDWSSQAPLEQILVLEGKRVFFAHGHTFGVKYGTDDLLEHAKKHKAQIALFGHTHRAMTKYEEGVYLMNPGSVSMPRDGSPSYGVIDITPAGIVLNIVRF